MQFKFSGVQKGMLNPGPPFSLKFTISARIRGVFTLESLQNALERLRQHHPMLAVRVDPASACFTTEGVPPIPVKVIERMSDETWAREIEREVVQPSDYTTGPLFSCIWLRGTEVSDLLLVCDHITADGLAGIYALRDLLELLADPDLILEPLLPPRLVELIPPDILAKINNMVSSAYDAAPAGPTIMPSCLPSASLCILPFALDEVETDALVSRCRAEGVTVQAALCAAFSLTFAEREPEKPMRLVESPINIRPRLLEPVGEVYGNYISLIYSDVNCSTGKNVWDIARQVGRSLVEATDEQLFTNPIFMMAVADRPLPGPVISFNYDLSISNLGRINIPAQYGQLQLESIYGPTMNVSMPGHRILGVATFDGRMRCTFTSRDPEALQILRRARKIMAAMVSIQERPTF